MFNFMAGPEMMGRFYGENGGFDGYFGGVGTQPLGILLLILFLFAFIFWLVMLFDLVKRPVKDKTMWAILFVFTHIIGAIVYYFTARKTTDMSASHEHHDGHQHHEGHQHHQA